MMNLLKKNIIFVLLIITAAQLMICKADPLSEDLLEVNNNPEQIKDLENQMKFKEKCVRAAGSNEAFEDMQVVKNYLSGCVRNIFPNISALQVELFNAYEDGNYEIVRKYCNMKDNLAQCFSPFMKTLENCMENDDEKKFVHVGMKFLKSVSEYVCYNNGVRTRNLIEQGGLECIDDKTNEILHCFYLTKSLKTMFQSSYEDAFVFNEAKCTDIPNYESCVVKKLKSCNNTSAIEFHDGLFRVIKRIVPCDFTKKHNMV